MVRVQFQDVAQGPGPALQGLVRDAVNQVDIEAVEACPARIGDGLSDLFVIMPSCKKL